MATVLRTIFIFLLAILVVGVSPAWAGLNDDRYDGNIFALYGGNGSLVPPRFTLAQSLQRDRPIVMVLYVEDSKDCKEYAAVLSRVDAYYGRVTDLVFTNLDAIAPKAQYDRTEPRYYYKGFVPQTVIFNEVGEVVLNESGVLPFEQVDDVLRDVFDLLPRSESVELKRRQINELSTEIVEE